MARRGFRAARAHADPDAISPARREELLPAALGAVIAGFFAVSICAAHGYLLLYGDAVAHLGIARRVLDTPYTGLEHRLQQLGGVWLPLPHLLMLPFIGRMEWWHNGLAGTFPSLICFVLAVAGFYRLARRLLAPRWALVATAFFGLNANLLYLATTAMTEPLFLALLIWIVGLTLEFVEAAKAREGTAAGRMIALGVLVLAAVFTRYDGWILGAVVWAVVAWYVLRDAALRRAMWASFVLFTLLCLAGPLSWFAYNQHFAHDWLDFMRGPYSAKEIDRRTSPPGAHHYFGWHDPAWSLMLYARTAQVDAAWWETGWLVMIAAVTGLVTMVRLRVHRAALLLWVPLPFYVYSISFGSVPIFIPQLYPHSFYNSRYGMEMLPAFALFGTLGLVAVMGRLPVRFGKTGPVLKRLVPPFALLLIALNSILMMHATPLVLKEAMVNSSGRLALEGELVQQMASFTPGAPIMMDSSHYVGALQRAEIPLVRTLGPGDYYKGLALPSEKAAYVIAGAGDAVAQAVAAHPEGLSELTILCTTGEPCVRVYRSERFFGGTGP